MSFRKDYILSLKPDTNTSYVAGETEEVLTSVMSNIV